MRDYQKEYIDHPIKCVVCGQAWVPDARHVNIDKNELIEDCKPDNLTYLEYKYEQSIKTPKKS